MIKDVEILVLVEDTKKIEALLQEYKNITIVADYESLKEKLLDFDYLHSRVALIEVKYLTQERDIEKDLMYKGASLVAYGKNISASAVKNLYGLDFKGIIDTKLENGQTILNHVVRRANLYASTYLNNFVRGIIEYKSIGEEIKEVVYLLNALINKYKISNRDALNIRLVLLSLIVAFKDENILKVATTLKIIFKSEKVDSLYQNYRMPINFQEKIIAILLQIYNRKYPSDYIDSINMSNVEPSLIEEIEEIYENKRLDIASLQDSSFFAEQLNLFTLEHYPQSDISLFETFFVSVNNLITASLVDVHILSASIISRDETITVRLHYAINIHTLMKENIERYSDIKNNTSVALIDNYTISIAFIKNIQKEVSANKIVDVSNIEAQHYSDDTKISATKFLEEFIIDQALLDDLEENERDMSNLFYEEETLSQTLLDNISIVLQRYSYILNQTIEFVDLAVSLESLSIVLNNANLEELNSSKKETIHFYLQGLMDDLQKWKNYIFIEPNTPDIHYLDASLLENCATIESFIVPENSVDKEIESNDDLEFF